VSPAGTSGPAPGGFPPSGLLPRRHGRPCDPPLAFEGRRLGPEDLPAVIALHALSRQGVAAELVAHDSDDFFRLRLAERGRLLGLFAEGELVAYGVLGLPRAGDASFADDLPDPPPAESVAEVDGVAVRPDLRGNGLHRLLVRWRLAEAAGRALALATAAPGNLYSLSNLLSCGFEAVALLHKYGGARRFLLARPLDAEPPAPAAAQGRWVPLERLEEQQALLRDGWRGCRLRLGEPALLYRPPVASAGGSPLS